MITDMRKTIFDSPIGKLEISTNNLMIHQIEWCKSFEINALAINSSIISEIFLQVSAYFEAPHNNWQLDLSERGTVFQRKVWQYLKTIPLGETRYYSDVAKALNTSSQAVGNACRANPFVIVVPCHRVLSKVGLGGYDGETSGHTMIIKQWLLDHERQ